MLIIQHRRLSYSRHAVNDRDLSTQVNYRMHMNIRRMMGEHKHRHKRSKKLLKVSIDRRLDRLSYLISASFTFHLLILIVYRTANRIMLVSQNFNSRTARQSYLHKVRAKHRGKLITPQGSVNFFYLFFTDYRAQITSMACCTNQRTEKPRRSPPAERIGIRRSRSPHERLVRKLFFNLLNRIRIEKLD